MSNFVTLFYFIYFLSILPSIGFFEYLVFINFLNSSVLNLQTNHVRLSGIGFSKGGAIVPNDPEEERRIDNFGSDNYHLSKDSPRPIYMLTDPEPEESTLVKFLKTPKRLIDSILAKFDYYPVQAPLPKSHKNIVEYAPHGQVPVRERTQSMSTENSQDSPRSSSSETPVEIFVPQVQPKNIIDALKYKYNLAFNPENSCPGLKPVEEERLYKKAIDGLGKMNEHLRKLYDPEFEVQRKENLTEIKILQSSVPADLLELQINRENENLIHAKEVKVAADSALERYDKLTDGFEVSAVSALRANLDLSHPESDARNHFPPETPTTPDYVRSLTPEQRASFIKRYESEYRESMFELERAVDLRDRPLNDTIRARHAVQYSESYLRDYINARPVLKSLIAQHQAELREIQFINYKLKLNKVALKNVTMDIESLTTLEELKIQRLLQGHPTTDDSLPILRAAITEKAGVRNALYAEEKALKDQLKVDELPEPTHFSVT